MTRKRPVILVLSSVFLILRLAVLFSQIDNLYEEEELYRGTIAREIIQGPLIPLWEYLDYQVEYFPGGTLVVGVLAVPFFLLFGQTYISLKLVGLLFALGTFIVWFIFLDKFFSRRAAIIASLLFIFCPPFHTKMSLIAWGAHPEANLFTALSLFIFYRIFFRGAKESIRRTENRQEAIAKGDFLAKTGGKSLDFLWLGLCAGFAFWFVQTYLLTLAFILLCWFAFERGFLLRKTFYLFVGSFLLGFSPGIFYELFYKNGVFSINGDNVLLEFAFCDMGSFLPRVFSFLGKDLPASFLFSSGAGNYLYYLLFLIAFGTLSWLNRRSLLVFLGRVLYPLSLKEIKLLPGSISKEFLLLVYPALFVLIYGLSNYNLDPQHWRDYIGYRYIIPLIPFILAICAIFLDKIYHKKAFFWLFLSLILALGISGNLGLVSARNFGRFFSDKGYSYRIIGDKIGLRVKDNLGKYILPFNRLEDELRQQFYEGLGSGIAWRLRNDNAREIIGVIENEIPSEYWPACYRGWGMLFAPEDQQDFQNAINTAERIKEGYRKFFYEGWGRNMLFAGEMDRARDYLERIAPDYRESCYWGIGYEMGFRFKNDAAMRLDLMNQMEARYRNTAESGIAPGMRER